MPYETSCKDWAERIQRRQSMLPAPLFPKEAEKALDIFKALKIVDAPGSPTFGDACAQWVFDLVASIFGAYDSETGKRMITEWFVLVPKKNSKSTIAAGIMMTAMVLNWRQSAEFSILAPTVEVANNSYAPARDIVKHDEELSAIMHVQNHLKSITHRETGGSLKVVAADSNTVGGKKSVGILIDELWLFGKKHDAENMLREATGGLASRPEGFVIYLTTQSDEAPAGVFKQKLEYARNVRDGIIDDPRFVPLIFEHPPEMVKSKAHLEAENLGVVNPNLGYSVDRDFLEREYKKAKSTGVESFIGFMAKHANVEMGLALRSDRWAGADYWQDSTIQMTLDAIIMDSEVIEIGIDGGGLDDLLGLYVIGRVKDSQTKIGWGYAWAHPSVLERRKEVAPSIIDFSKSGSLTLVSRVGDDVDQVADIADQIYQSGKLDKIGCDPVGIGAILDKLEEKGIPNEKIVAVSQGWKLGGAIKTAERWLASGEFTPADQPMMAWCVSNAKIEPRANSILITKQASGSAKIDPLMAMLNAVSLMSLNPESLNKDIYLAVFG